MNIIREDLRKRLIAPSYVDGSNEFVEKLKNVKRTKMTWEELRDQAARTPGVRTPKSKYWD